jgi:hypothetical protein
VPGGPSRSGCCAPASRSPAGERVSVTRGDDTLQLGVDVVVDDAVRIAFLHRAADAVDRTPPQELITVLRTLDRAPVVGDVPENPALDWTMLEGHVLQPELSVVRRTGGSEGLETESG